VHSIVIRRQKHGFIYRGRRSASLPAHHLAGVVKRPGQKARRKRPRIFYRCGFRQQLDRRALAAIKPKTARRARAWPSMPTAASTPPKGRTRWPKRAARLRSTPSGGRAPADAPERASQRASQASSFGHRWRRGRMLFERTVRSTASQSSARYLPLRRWYSSIVTRDSASSELRLRHNVVCIETGARMSKVVIHVVSRRVHRQQGCWRCRQADGGVGRLGAGRWPAHARLHRSATARAEEEGEIQVTATR
jgi:hypothetical protein